MPARNCLKADYGTTFLLQPVCATKDEQEEHEGWRQAINVVYTTLSLSRPSGSYPSAPPLSPSHRLHALQADIDIIGFREWQCIIDGVQIVEWFEDQRSQLAKWTCTLQARFTQWTRLLTLVTETLDLSRHIEGVAQKQ